MQNPSDIEWYVCLGIGCRAQIQRHKTIYLGYIYGVIYSYHMHGSCDIISTKSMCLMKTKWRHHPLFIKCYQCITVSGTEERFNITRAILKCKYTREHNLHGLFLWKAQYTFSVCLFVWSLVASIQYYVHLILWFGRPKPIWNWKTDRRNERIGDFYNALLKVTVLSVMNENCLPRARCAWTAS